MSAFFAMNYARCPKDKTRSDYEVTLPNLDGNDMTKYCINHAKKNLRRINDAYRQSKTELNLI